LTKPTHQALGLNHESIVTSLRQGDSILDHGKLRRAADTDRAQATEAVMESTEIKQWRRTPVPL
jgi:hypothetical protein